MLLQRVRDAGIRIKHRFSNGPRRAQSNEYHAQSILRRYDVRQSSGICLYPIKRTAYRESRWYRGFNYSSLTDFFCQGLFYCKIYGGVPNEFFTRFR